MGSGKIYSQALTLRKTFQKINCQNEIFQINAFLNNFENNRIVPTGGCNLKRLQHTQFIR